MNNCRARVRVQGMKGSDSVLAWGVTSKRNIET